MAVASLVLEDGGSEDQAIAALLHDAGEDAGGEAVVQRIEQEFNATVAEIVRACSDSLKPSGEKKDPWSARKQRYLEHLVDAPAEALLVTAADKVHNARSTLIDIRLRGAAALDGFNATPEAVLWYYDAVLDIIRKPLDGKRVLMQLEETVEVLYAESELKRHVPPGTVPPADADKH